MQEMEKFRRWLAKIIFMGRWLQLPIYFGLMVTLLVYVWVFLHQLGLLVGHINSLSEVKIMLHVLDLIDVVMIANLLIMVIVGGYETFVSPLYLDNNPERPEWLEHVNSGSMKVKLAIALISISSIHLLRTFIDAASQTDGTIRWQIMIHLTLVASTIAIALTNWLMTKAE